MELHPVRPVGAPQAVGGYAQGLQVDGASRWLFVSGQVPEDPDGVVPTEFDALASGIHSG